MYPNEEQSHTTVERAPFWAILERTAALAAPGVPMKMPQVVEFVDDTTSTGPGDTRPVASDSQRPGEVFAHIRGLLVDVESESCGTDGVGAAQASLAGASQGSSTTDTTHESISASEDKTDWLDAALPDSSGESREAVTARDLGSPDLAIKIRDGQVNAPSAKEAVPSAGETVAARMETGEVRPPSPDRVESFEFGAHAAVIPGTEEFMSSLARKNRAFEHTGEIDTDLDLAADKLGWSRSDDDLVVKRKIFRKKKSS